MPTEESECAEWFAPEDGWVLARCRKSGEEFRTSITAGGGPLYHLHEGAGPLYINPRYPVKIYPSWHTCYDVEFVRYLERHG